LLECFQGYLLTHHKFVCGGGAYNSYLLEQLRWRLRKHNWSVQPTDVLGLSPTWVEATAFAWFLNHLQNALLTMQMLWPQPK
jgi:anhydro-N-acetylmuramic acid kinase